MNIRKKIKILLCVCIGLITNTKIFAQLKLGVNIGNLNSSAILELESSTTSKKGLLLPRLDLLGSTTWGLQGSTFSEGMLVYNRATTTTAGSIVTPGLYHSSASKWERLLSSADGSTSIVITDGKIQRAALTGDVTANANENNVTVTGIRGRSISSTTPNTNQTLTFNGSNWAPADAINIYTANGTISGARTVNLNNSTIGFTNGNVGIGTAAPTSKLHVIDPNTNKFQPNLLISSNPSQAPTGMGFSVNPDTNKYSSGIQFLGWGGVKEGGIFRQTGASQKSHLMFAVNSTNDIALSISSAGYIGMGAIIPQSKLHLVDPNKSTFQANIAVASDPGALTTDNPLAASVDSANVTKFSSGIQFLGRLNLNEGGIFRQTGAPGKSHLMFAVNAADDVALTINSATNVGIGTTNPKTKLHVKGGDITVDNLAGNANSMVIPDANGKLTALPFETVFSSTLAQDRTFKLNNLQWDILSNRGRVFFNNTNGTVRINGISTTPAATPSLSLSENGTFSVDAASTPGGRFIIQENGNVGIGLFNPSTKLDVNGAIKISGPTNINFSQTDTNVPQGSYLSFNDPLFNGGSSNGITSFVNVSGLGPGGFNFFTRGHVSTGNSSGTTPTELLFIGSDGTIRSRGLQSTGTGTRLVTASENGTLSGTAYENIFATTLTSNKTLSVGTNNLTINTQANGSVIFNASNPAATMRLNGVSSIPALSIGGNGTFSVDAPGTAGGRFIITDGTGTTGGFIGIGVIAPTYRLHVNGTVAGNAAYVNTSDMRFKKNIQPIQSALSKVLALRGVTFDWDLAKAGNREFDSNNHIGFIAQEIEKVLPQVVVTANDTDKTKSVAYGDVVPVLVEAIKELHLKNLELEKKIEAIINSQGKK